MHRDDDRNAAEAATEPEIHPHSASTPTTGSSAFVSESGSARYRVESVLGRGGMGEVLSAHDEQIGRSVAIKRLRTGDAPADAIARFVREARVQGRLDHPAIPPVHELWRDGKGQPFFVMKQLSGITLGDVLTKLGAGDDQARRKFPRQVLLRAFVDVCLAIEFAHTRGVVHRDLKPANVMLGEFGEVYVLDWGIARVVAEGSQDLRPSQPVLDTNETMAGAMLGTPGYMAPEQIRAERDLDGRADVYSLGCILFEILAGATLHPLGQPGIASALAGVDACASARAPECEIPPELDQVCMTATRVQREERYATAREVGDAVQRYLDGDRDVALREKLAAEALAAARECVARGDRRNAIRAAGRALALDPKSQASALVAQLMLEPPKEVPPEVEHELRELDDEQMRTQSRLSGYATLAYLAFVPVMYAAGFRETWFLVIVPALVGLILVFAFSIARTPVMWVAYISFAANGVLIAVFSRVLSPFLVAPGLAFLGIMVFGMHPRIGRISVLAAALITAVLGPWIAELAGLVSATTSIEGNTMILRMMAEPLNGTIVVGGLAAYTLVVVTLAGVLSRALALQRSDMERSLTLQSWQLRQLMPRPATSAESG
jgi:serine/threonine-protein kinase